MESQGFSLNTPPQPPGFDKPPQPADSDHRTQHIIVGVIALGILIAGVVFGLGQLSQKDKSPEDIIRQSFTSLAQTTSYEYSGEIKTKIPTEYSFNVSGTLDPLSEEGLSAQTSSAGEGDLSIKFSGAKDNRDKNDERQSLSLIANFEPGTNEEQAVGLDIIITDTTLYVRLSEAPNLGLFDLSPFENQWVSIDTGMIQEQFSPTNFQFDQNLTEEQTRAINKLFEDRKIIQVVQKLPDQNIGGVPTYRYRFTINEEELNLFIREAIKIVQSQGINELSYQQLQLQDTLEAIDFSEGGEIWIGKKDKLPYKISFTIKASYPGNITPEVLISITFRNFNKAQIINLPTSSLPLEDLLGGLFEEGYQPAPLDF